jgi:hypothetical protein
MKALHAFYFCICGKLIDHESNPEQVMQCFAYSIVPIIGANVVPIRDHMDPYYINFSQISHEQPLTIDHGVHEKVLSVLFDFIIPRMKISLPFPQGSPMHRLNIVMQQGNGNEEGLEGLDSLWTFEEGGGDDDGGDDDDDDDTASTITP